MQKMFEVGGDCEVMIRVDEESDDEDFQLISGQKADLRSKS